MPTTLRYALLRHALLSLCAQGLFALIVLSPFFTLSAQAQALVAAPTTLTTPTASSDTAVASMYLANPPSSQQTPLAYVNQLRARVGLSPFATNATLDKAATNHAIYLASNRASGHYQTQGKPNFTGVRPLDRAFFVGYPSGVVENVATGQRTPAASVDSLMAAIYHRFGLFIFDHDELGIGWITTGAQGNNDINNNSLVTKSGNTQASVLCQQPEQLPRSGSFSFTLPCRNTALRIESKRFAQTSEALLAKAPAMVLWPPSNATQVPPVFYDEDPDPLPNHTVSGYPISVQFNPAGTAPTEVSLELFIANGKRVEPVLLMNQSSDPNKQFSAHQFALFPLERLLWGTQYEAVLRYTQEGKANTMRWQFRTAHAPYPLTLLNGSPREPIKVKANTDYAFYVHPRHATDRFNQFSMSYSHQAANFKPELELVDYNTLRVRLSNGLRGDSTTIQMNNGITLPLVVD